MQNIIFFLFRENVHFYAHIDRKICTESRKARLDISLCVNTGPLLLLSLATLLSDAAMTSTISAARRKLSGMRIKRTASIRQHSLIASTANFLIYQHSNARHTKHDACVGENA